MAENNDENFSVEVFMEDGELKVEPYERETWVAYCQSGDGRLYAGNYKTALKVAKKHSKAEDHVVTVKGP